jgi:hypothetical protein
MVVSLLRSNRTQEAITSDAETAPSIARITSASVSRRFHFVVQIQFRNGVARRSRLSLLDAFAEGQIENYAQTVHSAVSLSLLSCYVTNMIDENRDCRGRGRLADASFAADVRFVQERRFHNRPFCERLLCAAGSTGQRNTLIF